MARTFVLVALGFVSLAGCGDGTVLANEMSEAPNAGREVSCGARCAAPVSEAAERKESDGERRKSAVQAKFGLGDPSEGPFPSDRFTIADPAQNTCRRVNLPKPVCADRPWDCSQIDLVNEVDGFNVQPRVSIPFNGPVDLTTVHSGTVFLVSLGSSLVDGVPDCRFGQGEADEEDEDSSVRPRSGWVVGINRILWDPPTTTLYAEADEMLDQHTRYALIVTRGVKDGNGAAIEPSKAFKQVLGDEGDEEDGPVDPSVRAYHRSLRAAIAALRPFGVHRQSIAAASVFTTISVTTPLETLRDQLAATSLPPPINFRIGPKGVDGLDGPPMVFEAGTITGMVHNREASPGKLTAVTLAPRLAALRIVKDTVARVAFGQFFSPNYLVKQRDEITGNWWLRLPAVGTFSGVPEPVCTDSFSVVLDGVCHDPVSVVVFIPTGTAPAAGWPLVIFGPGSADTMLGSPFNVAAMFASHGFATVTIQPASHGWGPASTLTVSRGASSITFSAGGRSMDANNDGLIVSDEGSQAGGAKGVLLTRHPSRQTVVDLLQLIREIKVGIDVDHDGIRDLDPSRIYYAGTSAGATIGVLLFTVSADIRAASFTGIGGRADPASTPVGRSAVGLALARRVPSLLNPPGTPLITDLGGVPVDPPHFNENRPERDVPPLVNTIAGALPIQVLFENINWIGNVGGAPFASHLRFAPLPGVPVRPFMVQESRGDQNVPNPSTANFVRAGLLADRVTIYRHDLFANSRDASWREAVVNAYANPHSFLIRTDNQITDPAVRAEVQKISLMAQDQVGRFFKADGLLDPMFDPDGAGPLFEAPAATIPEDYGFIY